MKGIDAEFLAASSDILGSQHGGVGGGLVTVSLDLHTTGDTADGFATAVYVRYISLLHISRLFDHIISNSIFEAVIFGQNSKTGTAPKNSYRET